MLFHLQTSYLVQPNRAHSMIQVSMKVTGQSQILQKKERTGHILDASSPTDFITSIITAFCDSFVRCPLDFSAWYRNFIISLLGSVQPTREDRGDCEGRWLTRSREAKVWLRDGEDMSVADKELDSLLGSNAEYSDVRLHNIMLYILLGIRFSVSV